MRIEVAQKLCFLQSQQRLLYVRRAMKKWWWGLITEWTKAGGSNSQENVDRRGRKRRRSHRTATEGSADVSIPITVPSEMPTLPLQRPLLCCHHTLKQQGMALHAVSPTENEQKQRNTECWWLTDDQDSLLSWQKWAKNRRRVAGGEGGKNKLPVGVWRYF